MTVPSTMKAMTTPMIAYTGPGPLSILELGLCSAFDDTEVIPSGASDKIAVTVLGIDDGLASPLASAELVQVVPESE